MEQDKDPLSIRICEGVRLAGLDEGLLHVWPQDGSFPAAQVLEPGGHYYDSLTIGLNLPDGLVTIEFPMDATAEVISERVRSAVNPGGKLS